MVAKSWWVLASLLAVVWVCNGQAPYRGKLVGTFVQRGTTQADHHNVAGTIYAVDENTLWITGFTYDGLAPDAFIWIGTTNSPDNTGTIVPKALGQGLDRLGTYSNEDLIVDLPGSASIQDFKWISIWCRMAGVNFADITIPTNFQPPRQYSLGDLPTLAHRVYASDVIILNTKQIRFVGLTYDGYGPDAYYCADYGISLTRNCVEVPEVGDVTASPLPNDGVGYNGVTKTVQLPGTMTVFDFRSIGLWCKLARQNFGDRAIPDLSNSDSIIPFDLTAPPELPTYDNCVELQDDQFQVSWTIENSDIIISLSSRQLSGSYMAFGISGSDTATDMDGADVAVAWIDQMSSEPRVTDYYLQSRQQCVRSSGLGVCPDTDINAASSDDVTLVGSEFRDGISYITYRRPLVLNNAEDRSIITSGPQYIVWALGSINQDGLAIYHDARTMGDVRINFGQTSSSCPAFTGTSGGDKPNIFEVPPIVALEETTFTCDIGLSGGPEGYQGITGNIGWGIAWYINNDLIPEITVRRGVTYTFEVFGGDDPNLSASYHPFYITNSESGGYYQLDESERVGHDIYAGPTDGTYCYWEVNTPVVGDSIPYEQYRASLQRTCQVPDPVPGVLTWTPDENTPDIVYYQCYTHKNLGWKIIVSSATLTTISMVNLVTSLFVAFFIM